jgi:hypothetical protein
MTKDDIIKLARRAGAHDDGNEVRFVEPRYLERFADLVRADERNRTWTQEHWTEYERSIAAVERELIAQSMDKQAELAADDIDRQWAQEMAAAIRAKGNT